MIHGVGLVNYSVVKERREKEKKETDTQACLCSALNGATSNRRSVYKTERYSSGEARGFGGWDRLRTYNISLQKGYRRMPRVNLP
jgi:hypothetical protein